MNNNNIDRLISLIALREKTYEENNAIIFNSISGVIRGIALYAIEEGILDESEAALEMMGVSYDADDSLVIMTGIIKPNIGTTVMSSIGEWFNVATELDQDKYSKIVRIMATPDIIDINDADETIEYIRRTNRELAESIANDDNASDELREFAAAHADSDTYVADTLDISADDRDDDEILAKILEGATNPSGIFN